MDTAYIGAYGASPVVLLSIQQLLRSREATDKGELKIARPYCGINLMN